MTDSDFERLNGYVDEVIDSGYGTGPARPMYKYRGKVRAYYQYRPYLYEFDAEGMSIAYEFRFWKYSVPPESFMQEISRRGREFFDDLSGSGYVSYYEIFETEAAVLSYFMVKHKRYLGMCDKVTGTSSLWEEQDFGKVIPQLPLYVVGTYGDFFVSPMFASELKESDGLPADLQAVVSGASENDIVLMLFK